MSQNQEVTAQQRLLLDEAMAVERQFQEMKLSKADIQDKVATILFRYMCILDRILPEEETEELEETLHLLVREVLIVTPALKSDEKVSDYLRGEPVTDDERREAKQLMQAVLMRKWWDTVKADYNRYLLEDESVLANLEGHQFFEGMDLQHKYGLLSPEQQRSTWKMLKRVNMYARLWVGEPLPDVDPIVKLLNTIQEEFGDVTELSDEQLVEINKRILTMFRESDQNIGDLLRHVLPLIQKKHAVNPLQELGKLDKQSKKKMRKNMIRATKRTVKWVFDKLVPDDDEDDEDEGASSSSEDDSDSDSDEEAKVASRASE